MKKLLTISVMLMVIQSVYAFDWIEPIMNLKISYNLDESFELIDDSGYLVVVDYLPAGTIFLDITVGAELLQYTFIEGEFDTAMLFGDMNPMDGMFLPFQMDYGVRAGVQFAGVRIAYEHHCYHPIEIYHESYAVKKYGGYDRVYLEFDLNRFNEDRR